MSSGCIRMLNADVAELFERVEIGTKVIVHGGDQPIMRAAKSHPQPARAALERPLQPARVALKQPARVGPAVGNPVQQKAVRAALEQRRALRRRRPTVADWLRSLEESE